MSYFAGFVLILLAILGFAYGVISNLPYILMFIVVFAVLVAIWLYAFKKLGFWVWGFVNLILLIVLIVGSNQAYKSYYVYVTNEDILLNVHEEFYTYLTEEERELFYEDIKDEEVIVLPKGTELRTKNLYFNFKYDTGYMFRIKHQKRELFIYNKKKLSLPYELITLVGEKTILGNVKYIENVKANIIQKDDNMIAEQSDFSTEILTTTQDFISDGEELEGLQQKVNSCAYLGKDIKAYYNGTYYEEYDGTTYFELADVAYKYGFKIGTYEDGGTVNFNLGGNYDYFAGVAGNVDGINYSVTYNVFGDGELLGTVDVNGGCLPTPFEFNVTGIEQLSIIATGNDNYADGVGFGNAVLYNEESEKPNIIEFKKLSDVAYLGVDINSYVFGSYYEEYNGEATFNLGGEPYSKGFTIGTYPHDGYAHFNIGGYYKVLSGTAGNVDGVNYSVIYKVLGDGVQIGTIEIIGAGLPTEFTFDVTGVEQLSIIATGNDNYADGVGFGNVVLK